MTESLCCIAESGTTLQISYNLKKKKTLRQKKKKKCTQALSLLGISFPFKVLGEADTSDLAQVPWFLPITKGRSFFSVRGKIFSQKRPDENIDRVKLRLFSLSTSF